MSLSNNINLYSINLPNNLLTSLDVSNNINLNTINIGGNQLTTLDISSNINLWNLYCNNNQLTNLDVSNNINLTTLSCHENQLITLDVSKNVNLTMLSCSWNQLNCLNLKNGNNTSLSEIYAIDNNLMCIEVDDATYSTTNWVSVPFQFAFDAGTYFSTNCNNTCSAIGIEDVSVQNINIYPNPTTDKITISLEEYKNVKITIRNSIGQIIYSEDNFSNNIDLELPKSIGLYFLVIEIDKEIINKIIIKL